MQADNEDSDTQEEEVPDIWSDELFPLNIIPFSDDDNDNDPDYQAPQATETEESTSSSSEEEEEEDNMANAAPATRYLQYQGDNWAPFPPLRVTRVSMV